ncbi:hypothetical protein V8C26DRAFT_381253 [Trichoderma gracile]
MGKRQRPTSSSHSRRVSHLSRRTKNLAPMLPAASMIPPRRDPQLDGARFRACNATCWALVRRLPYGRPNLHEPHVSCCPVSPLARFPLASQPRTSYAGLHGQLRMAALLRPPASCVLRWDEMALTRASVDDQRLVQDLFPTSPDRTSSLESRYQRHTFIGAS